MGWFNHQLEHDEHITCRESYYRYTTNHQCRDEVQEVIDQSSFRSERVKRGGFQNGNISAAGQMKRVVIKLPIFGGRIKDC